MESIVICGVEHEGFEHQKRCQQEAATGFMFDALGNWQGFLTLAGAATIATALLWLAMPETKPTNYLD